MIELITISSTLLRLYIPLIDYIANYKNPAWKVLIRIFQQQKFKIKSIKLVSRLLHDNFFIMHKSAINANIPIIKKPNKLILTNNPSS